MPDYSNGKIYTIRCRTDDNKIYVGSTIQPLAVRFGGHKRDSKRDKCKNVKLYIEVNGNWDNWYIELHEIYPCSCKEELCKREGEIIRLIGTLNMVINGRSKTEYYKQYQIENVEKIKEYKKEYSKEYHIENIDRIKEQKKQYRIQNADKIKESRIRNADIIKQYQIENADKLKEYRKQYYLKKKEEKKKSTV